MARNEFVNFDIFAPLYTQTNLNQGRAERGVCVGWGGWGCNTPPHFLEIVGILEKCIDVLN